MTCQLVKLWLDDVRPAPAGWLHVKTVEDAINAIVSFGVSDISFDHDLGTEKTGYDLAKWVEEQAFWGKMGRIKWAVHSANPSGKANIERAMLSSERFWDLQSGDLHE